MRSTKKNSVLAGPCFRAWPPDHPSTRSLRTHTHKRLQGCLPNPPDAEHALTHPSLSARVPACVRRLRRARARARRTCLTPKANQTKECIPGSPSQSHTGGQMKKNAARAMFSAQGRQLHLLKKSRSLDRRLALHVRLPPKPALRGPVLKGLSDAGDAGDVRDAGMLRCW